MKENSDQKNKMDREHNNLGRKDEKFLKIKKEGQGWCTIYKKRGCRVFLNLIQTVCWDLAILNGAD